MRSSPSAAHVANQCLKGGIVAGPLDLQRLAVRIERLQHARTREWHGGDELEFRSLMPGGRGRQVLPDPRKLRELADRYPLEGDDERWINRNWRNWLTWAMRAEGLVRDNDPRNPKRMIRDISRGKYPRIR
jgi:hypothetical protein